MGRPGQVLGCMKIVWSVVVWVSRQVMLYRQVSVGLLTPYPHILDILK